MTAPPVQVAVQGKDNLTPVLITTTAAIEKFSMSAKAAGKGVQDLNKELQSTNPILQRVQTGFTALSDEGPQRGLRAIKGGLASVSLTATGLQGPLGKISEGLLMFGGGGVVTMGVLAGIALMAAAWNYITGGMGDVVKKSEELRKSFERTARGSHGLSGDLRELAVSTAEAVQKSKEHVETLARYLPDFEDLFVLMQRHKEELLEIDNVETAMAAHRAKLKEVQDEANREAKRITEEQTKALKKLDEQLADVVAQQEAWNQGLRDLKSEGMEYVLERLRLKAEGFAGVNLDKALAKWRELFEAMKQVHDEETEEQRREAQEHQADVTYYASVQKGVASFNPNAAFDRAEKAIPQELAGVEQAAKSFSVTPPKMFTSDYLDNIKEVQVAVKSLGAAWMTAFQAIGQGKNVFESLAQGGKKVISDVAKFEAQKEEAKGVAAIAESIWPPNPAAYASALEHFAAAALFSVLAGAAGGGGGSRSGPGSSGGLSQTSLNQSGQTASGLRGQATIVINGGLLNMSDPAQADALATAMAQLSGMDVSIIRG